MTAGYSEVAIDVPQMLTADSQLVKRVSRLRASEIGELIEFLFDRGIERLMHFTDVRNLDSILQSGLLPLRELRSAPRGLDWYPTDNFGVRVGRDGISTSITGPNFKMLHIKRNAHHKSTEGIARRRFAVIEIDPFILATARFISFPTNSATFQNVSRDIAYFSGIYGLRRLFMNGHLGNTANFVDRAALKLKQNETTDPQAEVLILDAVLPEHLKKIWVPEDLAVLVPALQSLSTWRGDVTTFPDNDATWNRHDWQEWMYNSLGESRLIPEGETCGCTDCVRT